MEVRFEEGWGDQGLTILSWLANRSFSKEAMVAHKLRHRTLCAGNTDPNSLTDVATVSRSTGIRKYLFHGS
jgi:hypothetical protein